MIKDGIGGANTNANGLKFENKTDLATSIASFLSDKYILKPHIFKHKDKLVVKSKSLVYDVYRIRDNKLIGIITKQNQFYNILSEHYGVDNVNHKRWKPDEVFFNFENNTVFIVEKKWQSSTGSVDEKIFGFVNKRRLYQNNFNQLSKEPKPTVEFSALFNSDWWLNGGTDHNNEKSYQDYFDNLRIDGIKIFFDKYDYWWFGL
ncbi:hypothetical protein DY138_05150 [Apilactobacillus timberlakei]|uniref:hypothetical protein n=1 Tax=Apilactobacillus timberlakei TaxID=2008380 RepID=UPI001127F5F8|nr:hypothetical protein [Apilactobacillus timberlakei]TPR18472.1 hypothetical protein DY138_05150 [Apilactobacillus timberlakei]TPR20319.1 hypothetical protein DY061_05060 [Apilactobacillus timberlakei]TPR22082.1 hypothetical protein DY083_05050 [Apilactobacillus timberlakei]